VREELRKLLAAEPFRPFRVVMSSGNSYEVRSPYMIVIEEDLATYFAQRTDLYSIIRLVQISSVDIIE